MSQKIVNEVSKLFDRFSNIMEKDTRGVQIGCYSVALVGLTIALRRVRPFSKFKNPNDIPNHFIKERRELVGLVKRIEPEGGILMIEHKPLVNLPIVPSGQLPVKISGVKVTGLGLNWLQAVVAGSEVKFVPVAKDKDWVQCEVVLVERDREKGQLKQINVGERLIKTGFCSVEPIQKPLAEDPYILSYYKRLHKAEDYAERKRLGLKYYIKPTKKALIVLVKQLSDLSQKLTVVSKKKVKEIPHIVSTLPKLTTA